MPTQPTIDEAASPLRLQAVRGLDESQEPTVLPPGFAPVLANWNPDQTGSLRCRLKWNNTDSAAHGADVWPATRKIRGLQYTPMSDQVDDNPGGQWWTCGVINGTSTHDELWAHRAYDGWTGGTNPGWHLIENLNAVGLTAGALDNFPLAMSKGVGALLYTHPKLNNVRRWQGAIAPTPTDAADTLRSDANMKKAHPGRCIIWAKGRFWMGGMDPTLTGATPYRLYYTFIDNANPGSTYDNWWNATDFPDGLWRDIGKDDAEPVRDLGLFQNAIVIGKRSSVWLLTGNSPETFVETLLDGAGAAKGRSICATPSGVLIAGERDIWWWAGGDPQRIGGPVQVSYQGGADAHRMTAYVAGKVFISSFAASQPIFVFDVETGVWTTETVATDAERPVSVASWNQRLVGGQNAATSGAGLIYRDHPYGARGKDFFTGFAETYHYKTPDLTLGRLTHRIRPSHAWVRLRQRGATASSPGVVVTPYCDGVAQTTQTLAVPGFDGALAVRRIDLGKTGYSYAFDFSHTPAANGGGCVDIEEIEIVFDTMPEGQ